MVFNSTYQYQDRVLSRSRNREFSVQTFLLPKRIESSHSFHPSKSTMAPISIFPDSEIGAILNNELHCKKLTKHVIKI